jgi:hypothetical protein
MMLATSKLLPLVDYSIHLSYLPTISLPKRSYQPCDG